MDWNFKSAEELAYICEKNDVTISAAAMQREIQISGLTKEEIRKNMNNSLQIMKKAIKDSKELDLKSMGGLIGGESKKLEKRIKNKESLCGEIMAKAISAAMGTMEINACMGLIVAAPTAGSCGILPGALITIAQHFEKDEEEILDALFTAGAIGLIVTRNATVAGAEGGCQAETGTASAMAAAAITELMGGTFNQALDSAAICLKNILGLVCDPIAGLVEAPCQKRNAIGVANAIISSELVLAGIESIIPFDQMVQTMYNVGRRLPMELRETALGGIAATPKGKILSKQIFG